MRLWHNDTQLSSAYSQAQTTVYRQLWTYPVPGGLVYQFFREFRRLESQTRIVIRTMALNGAWKART